MGRPRRAPTHGQCCLPPSAVSLILLMYLTMTSWPLEHDTSAARGAVRHCPPVFRRRADAVHKCSVFDTPCAVAATQLSYSPAQGTHQCEAKQDSLLHPLLVLSSAKHRGKGRQDIATARRLGTEAVSSVQPQENRHHGIAWPACVQGGIQHSYAQDHYDSLPPVHLRRGLDSRARHTAAIPQQLSGRLSGTPWQGFVPRACREVHDVKCVSHQAVGGRLQWRDSSIPAAGVVGLERLLHTPVIGHLEGLGQVG